MREEANSLKCGREQDLIDCIYGELDTGEMRSFNMHLKSCSDCSSQLAEFKSVRESLVAWRDESLGFVSPQIGNSAAAGLRNQRPSAIGAIREFFNLSPPWMKGAVAFASLLFCFLAVLAVLRLRDTPAVVAIDISKNAEAEQGFNAEVDRRVRAELKRLDEARQASVVASPDNMPPVVAQPRQIRPRNQIVSNPTQKARRPLSKSEREQLAADLRLIEGPAEGGLELLSDRVNQ